MAKTQASSGELCSARGRVWSGYSRRVAIICALWIAINALGFLTSLELVSP